MKPPFVMSKYLSITDLHEDAHRYYKKELERLIDACEQASENEFKSNAANKVIMNALEHYRNIGIGK